MENNELSSVNECRKTRPESDPYEVWDMGFCHYLVLKKYKSPKAEASDPTARWLVASVGEFHDVGDMYAAEVKRKGRKVNLKSWHTPGMIQRY